MGVIEFVSGSGEYYLQNLCIIIGVLGGFAITSFILIRLRQEKIIKLLEEIKGKL